MLSKQEQLNQLWEKYATALRRLDWALDQLDKQPKEIIKEIPVELFQAQGKDSYDPSPQIARQAPAEDNEPIRPGYNRIVIPDFSINAESNSETPVNAGFGTKFPENPIKGDMYLRVDQLPSILYKWNEKKWIEVDKTKVDGYAYDREYIRHLAEKLQSGEYEVDMLTPVEQEEIQRYLNGQ